MLLSLTLLLDCRPGGSAGRTPEGTVVTPERLTPIHDEVEHTYTVSPVSQGSRVRWSR